PDKRASWAHPALPRRCSPCDATGQTAPLSLARLAARHASSSTRTGPLGKRRRQFANDATWLRDCQRSAAGLPDSYLSWNPPLTTNYGLSVVQYTERIGFAPEPVNCNLRMGLCGPEIPVQWSAMKARIAPRTNNKVDRRKSATEVYDEPGHLIRRAQQIAVSMFHSIMGNGVTPVQYCVLRVLKDHPGIDQVTLAKLCALDTSTAADLAVRLEERGLVMRMMPMKSKRFRLLHLTPEGNALLNKLIPSSYVLAGRLFEGLNKEEQKVFLHLLKKFVHLNNEVSRAPLDRSRATSRSSGQQQN